MKITSKGQVTIPIEIREKAGLWPNTDVEFELEGNVVKIRKKKISLLGGRGREIVNHLKGKATSKLSTEEILALTRGSK